MNKLIRLYCLGSVAACVLLFIIAGILYWQYQALAQSDPNINNVRGWAWSGNTGWVSLNSQNCIDLNNQSDTDINPCAIASPPIAYGLRLLLNTDLDGGEIIGYAWSENLGWICFGNTCPGLPPVSGSVKKVEFSCKDAVGTIVTCDQAANNQAAITGWARILSLPEEQSWLRLDVQSISVAERTKISFDDPTVSSDFTRLDGFAWHYAGGVDSASSFGVGWLSFANSPEVLFPYLHAEGGDVFAKRISTFFPPPKGKYNAQYLVHVYDNVGSALSSRFTSQCTEAARTTNICQKTNYQLEVPVDQSTDKPLNFKLGRFDFKGLALNVANIGSTATNKYGDPLELNSSVLINSPSRALDGKVYVLPNNLTINNPLTFVNAPQGGNGAGTIIVRGDLLINNNISYKPDDITDRQELASVTWIVLGDVKISSTVKKVAGTFIVLGELGEAIEDSHLQCSDLNGSCIGKKFGSACGNQGKCGPQKVYYCYDGPKVGWECSSNIDCIKDSIIGKCSSDPSVVDKYRNYCNTRDAQGDLHDGCGKFITCYSGDCSASDLTVQGSVFARQFKLGRTFIDIISKDPAEKFVADGRIQLNSPPGMSDFAKGLPSFGR